MKEEEEEDTTMMAVEVVVVVVIEVVVKHGGGREGRKQGKPTRSPPKMAVCRCITIDAPRSSTSASVYPTSSGTCTIRGISYLAQIQSYEYNFPREQSFIVIVNPSVNCPALSITAVRRYNSVLSPSLLSFQPPRPTVTTIRRLRSLAVIH